MTKRSVSLGLVLAGVSVAAFSSPAQAAGPRVPAGCAFDGATGVLTCTASTSVGRQVGPISTNPEFVPLDTLTDGVSGYAVCPPDAAQYALYSSTFEIITTTTTTTLRHGLAG